MEFSCLGFLRCLLCCQDEFDDTFYADFRSSRTTLRTTGNLFNRPFISESDDRTSVRITSSSPIPTSVPRNPDTSVPRNPDNQRSFCWNSSSQNRNELSKDLETKLLVAVLHRAQLLSQSSRPTQSTSVEPRSSSSSSSSPRTPISSSKPPQSTLVIPSPTTLKPAIANSSSYSSYKAPEYLTKSLTISGVNSSSQEQVPTLKPALTKAVSSQQEKTSYALSESNPLPLYFIPEHLKDLIKKDVMPEVLKKPLSAFTYKDYFSALLYAEDYHHEKWSDYKLLNVMLELHEAAVYLKSDRRKRVYENEEKNDKIFVAFEMDAIPERRPYLLSRDLAYVRPSGSQVVPFEGIIYRVVKSNLVLVEFKDDFHSQHYPSRKYDISFSFNRVCLKRAHQALNSVSDCLFENFLFPTTVSRNSNSSKPALPLSTDRLDTEISSTVCKISSIQSSPPYLIAGPRCASEAKTAAHLRKPSRTGVIIQEAVIQTYKTNPHCRILICSPFNSTCDVLMRGLKEAIPESQMFRANAAFRERDDVPEDILSSCLYREECFACPPLQKLRSFKVIFSTFVSSYRLHSEGLHAGHFTHIFAVDSSFAIEPEAIIPLANFTDKNTVVILTGEVGTFPKWVRSNIARESGLKTSYFERLRKCRPYHSLSPSFITQLDSNRDACYL